MTEEKKPMTEAEKQIQRLEALRQQKETTTNDETRKAYFPPKTQTPAQQTEERLLELRKQAEAPVRRPRRPKIEGRQKSSKLTHLQIRMLEELAAADKRLRASAVTRIALNRLLDVENSAEENELEVRLKDILRQKKNQP